MTAPAVASGTEGNPTAGSATPSAAQAPASSVPSPAQPQQAPSSEGSPPHPLEPSEKAQPDDAPTGESAKHWNRIAAARQEDLNKYAPLSTAMDTLGGAQNIVGHLERFNRIMAEPELAKAVLEYESSGKLPTVGSGGEDDSDEYLSEEEKRMNALEQDQTKLRRDLLDRDARDVRTDLTKTFVDVIRDLHLTPEQQAAVLPKLEITVRQAMTTPQGVEMLNNLKGNRNSIEVMVIGQLSGEEREEAYLRKRDARQAARTEEQQAYATDAPATVQTGGQERPAAGLVVVDSVRAAYRELGLDPTKPLLGQ